MKIFSKIILTIIMIIFTTSFVFAADGGHTQDSTLSYTQPDSWYVSIPDTIYIGQQTDITATDVDIDDNHIVNVGISNFSDANFVKIQSVRDENNKLDVCFYSLDGNTYYTAENNVIGQFTNQSDPQIASFVANIQDTSDAIAGDYEGTLTFFIESVEK